MGRRSARDEVESTLTAHVTRVVAEFRGRVESWDVINEPFEDDGRWTDNAFHKALGPRYVEVAPRAAKLRPALEALAR